MLKLPPCLPHRRLTGSMAAGLLNRATKKALKGVASVEKLAELTSLQSQPDLGRRPGSSRPTPDMDSSSGGEAQGCGWAVGRADAWLC